MSVSGASCRSRRAPHRTGSVGGRVLVAAVLTLGAARLGLALSTAIGAAALWQLLAGVGGGGFMGTVFAAVSDRVRLAQRGRALGWVITGQSLSLVRRRPARHAARRLRRLARGDRRAAPPPRSSRRSPSGSPSRAGPSLARPAATPARGCRGVIGLRIMASSWRTRWSARASRPMAVYLATFLLTTTGWRCRRSPSRSRWWRWGTSPATSSAGWLADRRAGAAARVRRRVHGDRGARAAADAVAARGRPVRGARLRLLARERRRAAGADGDALRGAERGCAAPSSGSTSRCRASGWLGATALGGWLVARYGFGSLGVLTAAVALAGALFAVVAWRARRR